MEELQALIGRLNVQAFLDSDEDVESEFPSSTAITYMEYDAEVKELTIVFVGGGTYTYYGVSPQRWRAFENAASKGQYLNYKIKGNYVYSGG